MVSGIPIGSKGERNLSDMQPEYYHGKRDAYELLKIFSFSFYNTAVTEERKGFTKIFVELNQERLGKFKKWVFLEGMLFGTDVKWWNSKEKRKRSHEGVDLYFYQLASGGIERLKQGLFVPAFLSGEVLSLVEDYLGKSLFVFSFPDIVWAFGHIELDGGVKKGKQINKGEPVGRINKERANMVPPHMHISLAKLISDLPSRLDWSVIVKKDLFLLLDPMPYITDDYEILDESDFGLPVKEKNEK